MEILRTDAAAEIERASKRSELEAAETEALGAAMAEVDRERLASEIEKLVRDRDEWRTKWEEANKKGARNRRSVSREVKRLRYAVAFLTLIMMIKWFAASAEGQQIVLTVVRAIVQGASK